MDKKRRFFGRTFPDLAITCYTPSVTSLTRPAVAERWILSIAVATLLERLIILKTKGTRRPAMSKRVYKFTSAYYGLMDLEHRHLKLSTIDDLNDPFDLASVDTTDPQISDALTAFVQHFRTNFGLLCFSRNWDNLLLWSHYGASHTGLCLGFDIPDKDGQGGEYDMDVRYQPSLLQIRRREDVNFDLANRLLRTKHESWSYEQEVRVFVGLSDPPDEKGLWWFDFGPHLELKEVIVGAQFGATNLTALTDTLEKYGDAVECSWAYMRSDAFLLVRSHRPHSDVYSSSQSALTPHRDTP